MDLFISRHYRASERPIVGVNCSFPIWDYRSRRGCSLTSSSASLSSCSSIEGPPRPVFSDSGMDLESIAETVFEQLSVAGSEADTLETACLSDVTTSSGHSQDKCRNQDGRREARSRRHAKSPAKHLSQTPAKQDGRLCLNFIDAVSGAPNRMYYKMFRGVLSWINPELNIFMCSEKVQSFCHEHELDSVCHQKKKTVDIPDLAVVLFLQEDQSSTEEGPGKMSQVKEFFKHKPWRFHHSEWVGQGRIQACPQSNHDYFFVKSDLPLCSVRQIHCGEEHIRLMRFVTSVHWKDSVKLYSLLLAQEPDAMKQDFCVYTVEKFADVDLQLALKKLPKGIEPRHTRKCVLSFKVKDLGYLVPLMPHTCTRIAEQRWRTFDMDMNEIHIEVENSSPKPIRAPRHSKPRSRSSSQSRRRSSSSSQSTSSTLSCSAFTPVHPGLGHVKAEHNPNDRLSPRVFLENTVPMDVVTKVQTGITLQNRSREVYSPVMVEHEHQHTDSGFMDERSDDSMDSHGHRGLFVPHLQPQVEYTTSKPNQTSCKYLPLTNDSSMDPSHSIPDQVDSKKHGQFHGQNQSVQERSVPENTHQQHCTVYVHKAQVHNSSDNSSTHIASTQKLILSDATTCDTDQSCLGQAQLLEVKQVESTPLCHSSPKTEHSCDKLADTVQTSGNAVAQPAIESSHNSRSTSVPDTDTESLLSYQEAAIDVGGSLLNNAETISQVITKDPYSDHRNTPVPSDNNKPSLPSYHQAVSLLAVQRHTAGKQCEDIVNDAMKTNVEHTGFRNAGVHTRTLSDHKSQHNDPMQTPIAQVNSVSRLSAMCEPCLDSSLEEESNKEGEPENEGEPGSATSILVDTSSRNGLLRHRSSSTSKRVRFNDKNENFTYEAIEVVDTIQDNVQNNQEVDDDDVFMSDRVYNKAEGSESSPSYCETNQKDNSVLDAEFQNYCKENGYEGVNINQWQQKASPEVGFYI